MPTRASPASRGGTCMRWRRRCVPLLDGDEQPSEALADAIEPFKDGVRRSDPARAARQARPGDRARRRHGADRRPAAPDGQGAHRLHHRDAPARPSFPAPTARPTRAVRDLFIDRAAFDAWAARYAQRLRAENSIDAERRAAHESRRIRSSCCATTWPSRRSGAPSEGDFAETSRLAEVLQRPFDEQPEHEADAGFPPDWAQQLSSVVFVLTPARATP